MGQQCGPHEEPAPPTSSAEDARLAVTGTGISSVRCWSISHRQASCHRTFQGLPEGNVEAVHHLLAVAHAEESLMAGCHLATFVS